MIDKLIDLAIISIAEFNKMNSKLYSEYSKRVDALTEFI